MQRLNHQTQCIGVSEVICIEGVGQSDQSQDCCVCCKALTESAIDKLSYLQMVTCNWPVSGVESSLSAAGQLSDCTA